MNDARASCLNDHRPARDSAWIARIAGERALPWIVSIGVFAMYVLTLYPRVGGRFQFGDAAKWQYVGRVLGIPHPPGSPLYVLVSHVFGALPIHESVGTRIELLSASCGALAAGLLFATSKRLGATSVAALVASATFATSEAMWTFSTEAEVYAPLGLLVTFAIHRALVWAETRRSRDLALVMLASTLGVGIHYAVVTIAPALLVLVVQVDRKTLLVARTWLIAGVAVLLGTIPFAWMWMRAANAPYSELGTRTLGAFVDFVLVRQYRDDLSAFSLTTIWFERSAFSMGTICRSVGWVPIVLAPFGFARTLKTAGEARKPWWLVAAVVFPLTLLALHREGDERGEAVPALAGVALLFAAALDGCNVTRLAGAATTLLASGLTGATLAKAAAADPLRRDTDEIHDYPFDIECVVAGAERGAVIVSPHADYGARQIVSYYRFVDPRASTLSFAWMEDPVREWKWAEPAFHPAPSDERPVYVFRRDHARALATQGYRMRELRHADLGCTRHQATVLFRLDRANRAGRAPL